MAVASKNRRENRGEIIEYLQKLADNVLSLKKERRQKRPVVIEFSGSPKSGKTSSINSLELFLKRNGFTVKIIHERASVCPVYDKRSPMFNIWTSCMSISGMIGELEQKNSSCDVLILDRGVFDALCWFEWLSCKGMMESEQRQIIEKFITMDSLINRIDIVFAFCASPQVSIDREYATLLTNKPGSIMNEQVLSEYLESVKTTAQNKSKHFHHVFLIDTSNKSQDEVGKEVTDKTLNTLKDSLMERIGHINITPELHAKLNSKRVFKNSELTKFLGTLNFGMREEVEKHSNLLQPIPIAVFTDYAHQHILAIKKNAKAVSGGSPEKDKLLLYVGGHTRFEDFTDMNSHDFLSICKYTLRREIKEEIGVYIALDNIKPFYIYTPDSDKSKQHLGVCYLVERDLDSLKLRLDPDELVTTKGTTKSGRFHDVTDICNKEYKNLEPWSIEILRHCFKATIDTKQLSLYDFAVDD